MAKLNRLINGQDVTFDTHQAGDRQEVNWRALHLEKKMHGRRGKIRFPIIGNVDPTWSGMNKDVFETITREVRDELESNSELVDELAKLIVDVLKRFSSGQATTTDARQAASKIAGYFGLDERFERIMERYAQGHLVSFTSVHMNPETGFMQEISQSSDRVTVRKARKYARML